MPETGNQLKLIAIVLPEPLFSAVKETQRFIAETWGPKIALRTPPHLTLIPPVSITSEEKPQLESILQKVSLTNTSFEMHINGYDAFRPRVIYMKTNFPRELHKLYTALRDSMELTMPAVLGRYPDRNFVPHVTLAYKDVDNEQFKVMWKYFRNRKTKYSFRVDQFHLLKNTAEGWSIEGSRKLQDAPNSELNG